MEILTEEKHVDFRRVSSQRNVLITIRKDLCLDEMARGKKLGDGAGFSDVVKGIAKQSVGVVVEVPACLVRRNGGAIRTGDTEMAGDFC